MRLKHFIIVDEECARLWQLVTRGKMGASTFAKKCGSKVNAWMVPAVTAVIATYEFVNAIVAARCRLRGTCQRRYRYVSVRLPVEVHEALKKLAAAEGVSVGEVIRRAIVLLLEQKT